MRIICSLAPRGGGAGRPASATAGLEAQQRDLKAAGVERTFAEQTSYVGPARPWTRPSTISSGIAVAQVWNSHPNSSFQRHWNKSNESKDRARQGAEWMRHHRG